MSNTDAAAIRATYLAVRHSGGTEPDGWRALVAGHGFSFADAADVGQEIETGFSSQQAAREFYAATDSSKE